MLTKQSLHLGDAAECKAAGVRTRYLPGTSREPSKRLKVRVTESDLRRDCVASRIPEVAVPWLCIGFSMSMCVHSVVAQVRLRNQPPSQLQSARKEGQGKSLPCAKKVARDDRNDIQSMHHGSASQVGAKDCKSVPAC